MLIHDFLSELSGVTQIADGKWQASCPTAAHRYGDRSRGLRVGIGRDDRILVHCFAGCHVELIMSAMGLTLADLFSKQYERPQGKPAHNPRTLSQAVATALAYDAVTASLALDYVQQGRTLSTDDIQSMATSSSRLFKFALRMGGVL